MKQILLFLLASVLVLSLAACGGVVVDYDTPKSGELSAAYDFYRDSQASLATLLLSLFPAAWTARFQT